MAILSNRRNQPHPEAGLLADRPSASGKQNGYFYYAEDEDVLYRVQGEEWVGYVSQDQFDEQGASGRELAYAESDIYQTGISTTLVLITGLEVSFTVAARPVYVEAYLPWSVASAAGASIYASIVDGAGTVAQAALATVSTAGGAKQMFLRERISTPGEYVRRVGLLRFGGSGTLTNNFSGGTPGVKSSLTAIER